MCMACYEAAFGHFAKNDLVLAAEDAVENRQRFWVKLFLLLCSEAFRLFRLLFNRW